MKKELSNLKSYEYTTSNKEIKNRFYFGNEEPILKFEHGLNKITPKYISKKISKTI
jgi:CRISPR/Cas system-associated endonuclease/helicase Cas3